MHMFYITMQQDKKKIIHLVIILINLISPYPIAVNVYAYCMYL